MASKIQVSPTAALDEMKQSAYRAMATEWNAPDDVNGGNTDMLVDSMLEI